MTQQTIPAVFLGHGSPMNALDHNKYTEAWRLFGAAIPRPKAILAISAHWFINATAVTAMTRPPTIHDFYGFPQELFDVEYPASGMPELAEEIVEMVKPERVGLDRDSWGIDHGAWSVLVHIFPKADIPVVQLSINALKPFEYHFDLGVKLAPLREKGVLILASGNVVHNLGCLDWNKPDAAYDWNRRFDDAAKFLMTSTPAEVQKLREHTDLEAAVPTPDHFIPLLYLAGLASAAEKSAEILVEGYAMGSLSMTAFSLDAHCNLQLTTDRGAPPLNGDYGEQTNL